ncbi:hypothetical protein AK966_13245 [Vibrio sp. PID23_8]|jgi:hypothetical protein|nr:hypothetical protein AK965_14640 [Vibrio sp. PID17_43]RIZ53199.1 hypothetical protein AK966_13245 [Vibrio sp. PID23_8]
MDYLEVRHLIIKEHKKESHSFMRRMIWSALGCDKQNKLVNITSNVCCAEVGIAYWVNRIGVIFRGSLGEWNEMRGLI